MHDDEKQRILGELYKQLRWIKQVDLMLADRDENPVTAARNREAARRTIGAIDRRIGEVLNG